jgi:hypothetical protein
MTSKQDTIKIRLAAILRKARDAASSPAEVEEALAMAQKMMDKHGVTEADLDAATAIDYETRSIHVKQGQMRQHPVTRYCIVQVAAFTGCYPYASQVDTSRPGTEAVYKIVGLATDAEYCLWLMSSLIVFLDDQWEVYRAHELQGLSRDKIAEQRIGFVRGFCATVNSRVKEMTWRATKDGKNALVVRKGDASRAHYEDKHGKGGKSHNVNGRGRGNASGSAAGAQAAKAAAFGRGVADGGPPRLT